MTNVFDQHAYNVSPGPYHQGAGSLPTEPVSDPRARVLAFYLPQFHRIDENDEWWGAGFTEWTNVTKALPRYVGHLQPRLPADLGFYDLSGVEALRRQADLARRAGIHGFCIHDYWFAGRKVLEKPLQLLLDNPDIDLPFCLSWANENWSRRWDGSEAEVLLEQVYDPSRLTGYVESILPALRDPRYVTIEGRPLLLVYRPGHIPDAAAVFAAWRTFLTDRGLPNPFIVTAQTYGDNDPRRYGVDGAAGFPPHNSNRHVDHRRMVTKLDPRFAGQVVPYDTLVESVTETWTMDYDVFPTISPGWDNEARRPARGLSYYGSTPAKYADWLDAAVRHREAASPTRRVVFVNAWNEWAEGAVLEPDRHHGHAYLIATRDVIAGTHRRPVTGRPTGGGLDAPRVRPGVVAFYRVKDAVRGGVSSALPAAVKDPLRRWRDARRR